MEADMTARAAPSTDSLARWRSFSSLLEVPLDVLDSASSARPALEAGVVPAAGEQPTLGTLWAEIGRATLRTGVPELGWLTRSTLACTGPGDTSPSDLDRLAAAEARRRGASLRLPIYPTGASSRHYRHYESWFPLASAIDEGRLHAIAYVNPATAARAAVERLEPDTGYDYDDATGTLQVSSSGRQALVDAETFVSIGVMRGLLPEQVLIAAAAAAEERLRRLDRLVAGVWSAFTREEPRFDGGIPALLVGGRVVVDPLGGELIATGREDAEHEQALARATSSGLTTPCTCREPREVRKALRPRAEVYSFGRDSGTSDWLFEPCGDAHCAVYELCCPHATSRPIREAWASEGWTPERCREDWERRPLRGEVVVGRAAGWTSTAGLAYGEEIASFLTSDRLLGGVAREVGFPVGRTVTVYVPNANLLFMTDEAFDDEPQLQAALAGSALSRRLEAESLPLGAAVGLLATMRIETTQPLPLPVRHLEAGRERVGFVVPPES
jgi:hypothetical protein